MCLVEVTPCVLRACPSFGIAIYNLGLFTHCQLVYTSIRLEQSIHLLVCVDALKSFSVVLRVSVAKSLCYRIEHSKLILASDFQQE